MNVQDAMQDRILAGELLAREDVLFDDGGAHQLYQQQPGGGSAVEREQHVYEVLRKGGKKGGFKSGRKGGLFAALSGGAGGVGSAGSGSSCRIYGSMGVNRVQGDFHITAKGHGYWEDGAHVDHQCEFFYFILLLLFLELMVMAVKSIQLLTRNQRIIIRRLLPKTCKPTRRSRL